MSTVICNRIGLVWVLLFVAGHAFLSASADSVARQGTNLPPITVTARPATTLCYGGQSDNVALTISAEPGVLLNSQGGPAGQSDISIRGSSFSGAGLTVGGITLRNPQTEHFHAELPFPSGILTAPRVLTGLRQTTSADGHLVGTLSLDFLPISGNRRLGAGIGESGGQSQSLSWGQPLATNGNCGSRMAASVFGGRTIANAVDYADNDLDRWLAGVHVQAVSEKSQTDIAFGKQVKDFGARGYYGVTNALFAEEEISDMLVLAGSRWGEPGMSHVRLSAAWREITDDYRLFLTPPPIYANHHRTRIISAFSDGRQLIGDGIELAWRVGGEEERLTSTNLGDQKRKRGVLLLLPSFTIRHLRVTAGARAEAFTGDSPAILPQGGLDIDVTENSSLYCSYVETVRQPSFTELNYDSPGSLGNEGLERQTARNIEAGWRGRILDSMRCRLALFQRRSRNTVDWIRELPTSTRWVATDLGEVDTRGAELLAECSPGDSLVVTVAFTWLDKDCDSNYYAGRYVLDYANWFAKLSAAWQPCSACRIIGTQTLRRQEDNPVRTSDDFGTDGSVGLYFTAPFVDNMEAYVSIRNIWDDDFQSLAGQPTGGRRTSAGIVVEW